MHQIKYSLQHNNTFSQIIEEKEFQSLIEQSKKRVLESFEKRFRSNVMVEEPSGIFLREYIGSALKLVVLYVDLVGSTLMTRSLSVDRLANIIQTFTQEMSVITSRFGGQVLKSSGSQNLLICKICQTFVVVLHWGYNDIIGPAVNRFGNVMNWRLANKHNESQDSKS